MRANLERGVYGVLSLPGEALIVDTTNFADLDDQRLMQQIRARVGRASPGEAPL